MITSKTIGRMIKSLLIHTAETILTNTLQRVSSLSLWTETSVSKRTEHTRLGIFIEYLQLSNQKNPPYTKASRLSLLELPFLKQKKASRFGISQSKATVYQYPDAKL
jgi:hypothetical protein